MVCDSKQECSMLAAVETIHHELGTAIGLAKCRKCGCLGEFLDGLVLAVDLPTEAMALVEEARAGRQRMEAVEYPCLGCSHCYPAVASNALAQAFPQLDLHAACGFEIREGWPPVPGDYFVLCHGADCTVAVSTLGDVALAARIADLKPPALCMVGKTETENIGIDKVVRNVAANPDITTLILVGQDPPGHQPGRTLLALAENGVDEAMRVIGSPGKRPILRNVTPDEVATFRQRVQIIDLIGEIDPGRIIAAIEQHNTPAPQKPSCGCSSCPTTSPATSEPPMVQAGEPRSIEMDKAGYFVVLPQRPERRLLVEHYGYDNALLRRIEGADSRTIYWTIIENGWVSQLSHAAYLGKELARAEAAMLHGYEYTQDGA
ncbi:Tetrahydromethanopterin S-methyltransferase [Paramagnetospirillum magneticum AMB-1]|uniref:Tetrahydromethanopterin S-methyltransferase n=2 Tax=Paramagnetospirillum magneticum TaxID=84159 RepID=Q2W818_PARM1|nr:Tetrahydromethanopterin S-methyltransferase [Paramagnetospirillum magneticum AMB-1]